MLRSFIVLFFNILFLGFICVANADDQVYLAGFDTGLSLQSKQISLLKADAIEVYIDALFYQPSDPVLGNKQGKISLVEFFDYQCSHCVKMNSIVKQLILENPELKVIYKELPIRGGVSDYAAKAALAAQKQGKYVQMHDGLMALGYNLDKDKIDGVAKTIGLDMNIYQQDIGSSTIDQLIKNNYTLAQGLQLEGTPTFFIAKTGLPGQEKSMGRIYYVNGQVVQSTLQEIIQKSVS